MQTPITVEQEVNEVYAVIKGDMSVGIQDDLVVLKGFFYLQPEEVENVRQRFAALVEYIWGEKPSVQFDFEQRSELELEAKTWADQLSYEREVLLGGKAKLQSEPGADAGAFSFMAGVDPGTRMGLW